MHKISFLRYIIVFITLTLPLTAAHAQRFPAPLSPYVNDYANLIDAETEARITQELRQLRDNRGTEMTVVTIERRTDYGPDTGLEPFATALFNTWGIGKASTNNGILFLISSGDRETRIELGAGYGPEYDDRMKTVIDHTIIPFFRNEQFAEGIESGVLEIIKRSDAGFESTSGGWFAGVRDKILFAVFALAILLLALKQKLADRITTWRRCPKCGQRQLSVERHMTVRATKDAKGQEERHLWCSNCDYEDRRLRTVGRFGSRSGGSFGGGSSSGGGASGRW